MPSHIKITLSEKLDFVLGIFAIVIPAAYAALCYPFTAKSVSQPTLAHGIHQSVIRWGLDRFNVAQLQWAFPSSSQAYSTWIATRVKAEDAPSDVFTELVGDQGAKLHWVGRKSAKKVLLHFHGGGYVLPLLPAHLNLINHFRREIQRRSGTDVKVAFLEYTLVPLVTYPTQYAQATRVLQHILASGTSPADIVISGDSCGAQLAFQVLSHILHPHPALPVFPTPTVPFAGILALSPWVLFESNAPSFVKNDKDALSAIPLLTWGRMIREGTVLADGKGEQHGYWSEPLKAPPEWWRDTAKVTRHVLITYGQFEAFRDDDAAFATKLRLGAGPEVDIASVEEPRGVHIGPTIDASLRRAPSELTNIISGWVYDRVMG